MQSRDLPTGRSLLFFNPVAYFDAAAGAFSFDFSVAISFFAAFSTGTAASNFSGSSV
jgi:hypothetical protein